MYHVIILGLADKVNAGDVIFILKVNFLIKPRIFSKPTRTNYHYGKRIYLKLLDYYEFDIGNLNLPS